MCVCMQRLQGKDLTVLKRAAAKVAPVPSKTGEAPQQVALHSGGTSFDFAAGNGGNMYLVATEDGLMHQVQPSFTAVHAHCTVGSNASAAAQPPGKARHASRNLHTALHSRKCNQQGSDPLCLSWGGVCVCRATRATQTR